MKNFSETLNFILLNLLIMSNIAQISGYLFFLLLSAIFVFSEGISTIVSIGIISVFAIIPILLLALKFAIYPMLYEMYQGQEIAGRFFNKMETNKKFAKILITIACIIDFVYWILIHKIDEAKLNLVPELKIMCGLLLGILPCVLSLLFWFKIKNTKHAKLIITITSLVYAFIILLLTFKHSILYTDVIRYWF
ncbi:MAG: hypothetical protein VZR09_05065 [Candidatus Gastranaerophilaceae bacterium]|nr:hypothetical protein [Candidatus Gastranaerophilaceae bacterium]